MTGRGCLICTADGRRALWRPARSEGGNRGQRGVMTDKPAGCCLARPLAPKLRPCTAACGSDLAAGISGPRATVLKSELFLPDRECLTPPAACPPGHSQAGLRGARFEDQSPLGAHGLTQPRHSLPPLVAPTRPTSCSDDHLTSKDKRPLNIFLKQTVVCSRHRLDLLILTQMLLVLWFLPSGTAKHFIVRGHLF